MFRYSSSSSSTTPKSPARQSSSTSNSLLSRQPKGVIPPIDPLPTSGNVSRPSDVLISRCHEIKRISKMLSAYFEGLATAHLGHSQTLLKLSDPKLIQTPLAESSLFLPCSISPTTPNASTSTSTSTSTTTLTNSTGQASGWASLLVQIKENNTAIAEEHAQLAKKLNKDVVIPLKKIRNEIKNHIANLEKEVNRLSEIVLKEREASSTILTSLSTSIHSAGLPLSNLASDPSQDPVLLRCAASHQIKQQVIKENELLSCVLNWTDQTEAKEKQIWREIHRCWTIYESSNSNLLLTNQQRSMMLSGNIDCVSPETEWNYFLWLGHTIPSDTPLRSPDEVDYTGKEDPLTKPVKEGLLDRQSRILKSWKSGFYLLTPCGNLHSYANSASPLQSPTNSINLALCFLGPMPIPNDSTIKGKALEAMFTILEPDGKSTILRAKSWDELNSWWIELEKFTKRFDEPMISPSATTPINPLDPDSTTPASPTTLADEDHAAAVSEAMEEERAASGEEEPDDDSSNHSRNHSIDSIESHHTGDLGSPFANGVTTTTTTTPRKKSVSINNTKSREENSPTNSPTPRSASKLGRKKINYDSDGGGDLGIPASPISAPILTDSVESPEHP